MDQRAYATLFPREHFEKFISAGGTTSGRDNDDVAQQQQQQMVAGVRPEGHRPLGRARRVQFGLAELGNIGNNGAGVLCHLKSSSSKGGKKTTVLCASRFERAKVNPRYPEEGFVEVNVEIGACSRVENGTFSAASERATRVARLIRETVFPRKGGLLDWNVLKKGGGGGGGKSSSSSGEKDACWKFVVECLVLDDDMGTLDACLAAAVACARKTRAPTATESESREEKDDDNDGDNEKDGKGKKHKKRKMMLAVNREFKPVCLTVGAFTLSAENGKDEDKKNSKNGKKRKMNEDEKDEELLGEEKKEDEEDEIEDYEPPKQIVIVDPTYEETKLCDAFVNVVVDENGNVLGLEKSNQHGVASSEIDETVLAKAIAAAKLRHGEVWKRIEQFDEIGEDDEE